VFPSEGTTVAMLLGLLLLLFQSTFLISIIRLLIPVGQMGLSTYVMQSAFGLLLFYGYGLGVLLTLYGTMALGLGILFFICQVVFCRWWFIHHNLGPIEWVWRCTTSSTWQTNKIQIIKEQQP
jgi:uncharacterized protein